MRVPKMPWDVLIGGTVIAAIVAALLELLSVNRLLGTYLTGWGSRPSRGCSWAYCGR